MCKRAKNIPEAKKKIVSKFLKSAHLESVNRTKVTFQNKITFRDCGEMYEGWNFNSGNYLFTTDTK